VAPPAVSDADRRRLERLVEAMVQSQPWRETLARYRWTDRYLSGEAFARFSADEEARVEAILKQLGTGVDNADRPPLERYPVFVFAGLALTTLGFVVERVRAGRLHDGPTPPRGAARAMGWIVCGIAVNVLLLERAGFVVASIPLFWLTARAFDPRRPVRDAVLAVALSLTAYWVFARWLQIDLPSGPFAGWF
jgi:hypothetical protein